jgi:hypothetical protein
MPAPFELTRQVEVMKDAPNGLDYTHEPVPCSPRAMIASSKLENLLPFPPTRSLKADKAQGNAR